MSLRTKVLLSVGLIIFLVLGTSTYMHIHFLQREYFQSVEWRSEALAQSIVNEIVEMFQYIAYTPGMLQGLSGRCAQLYNSNQEKNVTHIAIVDSSNAIVAHNNSDLLHTAVTSEKLLKHLKARQQITILDGGTYHTLVPVFGTQEEIYLGSVDIGFPKQAMDDKIRQLLWQSVGVFILFMLLAFFSMSSLMHFILTRPVRTLLATGEELANGNLAQGIHVSNKKDEVAILGRAFNRIAQYMNHIANVASHISTGVLDGEVQVRSKSDILGKMVQEMLEYLKHVASVASQIAGGNLTQTIELRSPHDAFGQAIQSMLEGLRALIVQIRASAEQISRTEQTISSLTAQDISIVNDVHQSSETMISTMHEMGGSVEQVAESVNALSQSMELTSASISQMSSSITHIAASTNLLSEQSHQTIVHLQRTVNSLNGVAEQTEISKHASQETIREALNGQQAVEEVTTSMQTIEHTIDTAVSSINRFAQRSNDIDNILDVIRGIADQTSLLALNASIIAAQAGTHGRGFAVVADEIRNLAGGVNASTKDISSIVQSLQQDTKDVVQTIHEGAVDVKQGMGRTQQARETLELIIGSAEHSSKVATEIAETLHDLTLDTLHVSEAMGEVNRMTDEITAATNEQQASTAQIHHTMEDIYTMTSQIHNATDEQLTSLQHVLSAMEDVTGLVDQNLKSSQQVAGAAEELTQQASLLSHSVDRFKIKP